MRSEFIGQLAAEIERYEAALKAYGELDMQPIEAFSSVRNKQAKVEAEKIREELDERIRETERSQNAAQEAEKELQKDIAAVQEERRQRENAYKTELSEEIKEKQTENRNRKEENVKLHEQAITSIGSIITYERTAEASPQKDQQIQAGKASVYQVFAAINRNAEQVRKNEAEIVSNNEILKDSASISRKLTTDEETTLLSKLRRQEEALRNLAKVKREQQKERDSAYDDSVRAVQGRMEKEEYVRDYREKRKSLDVLKNQADYPMIMTLLNMMISYNLDPMPAPAGLSNVQKELYKSLCGEPLLDIGSVSNQDESGMKKFGAAARFFFRAIPDLTELEEEKKTELPGMLTDRFLETLKECSANETWEVPDAAYAIAKKLGKEGDERVNLLYRLQNASIEETMTLEQIYFQRKREKREREQEERQKETERLIREEERRRTRIMEEQAEDARLANERMEEDNRRYNERMAEENRRANERMAEENRRANEDMARESRRANEEMERLQREANLESQRHNREMEWNARQSAKQQNTGTGENPAYCIGCKLRRTCGHLGRPLGHCYVDY